MIVLLRTWFDDEEPRDLIRWGFAGAVVLALYAAILVFYLHWHTPVEIGDDEAPVALELLPIDSTPDAEQADATPAPDTMIESKPLPELQPEKEPETAKLELPPEPSAESIPEPAPKPPEQVEQPAPPAPVTAQRVKGGAPRIEPSWQTKLMRQLQRAKRYPREAQSRAQQGVVLLSFSLDRDGRVLAQKIARSSGYAELDAEALAMVKRAEPLPAFPASMPEARIDLTVPVRFTLR